MEHTYASRRSLGAQRPGSGIDEEYHLWGNECRAALRTDEVRSNRDTSIEVDELHFVVDPHNVLALDISVDNSVLVDVL